MLTITVNHLAWLCKSMGYQGAIIPTLTQFGYSSGAEIFFSMSGYMVGLVYFRKPEIEKRLLHRASYLYFVNALLFAAVTTVGWFAPKNFQVASGTAFTIQNPLQGTLQFLLLGQAPALVDVLQVYIILMIITAFAADIIRRRPMLAVAVSFLAYLSANSFDWLNLPGGPQADDYQYNMNPFAYQFLFLLGIMLGMAKVHRKLFAWTQKRRIALLALATLAFAAVSYRTNLLGLNAVLADKEALGALRIIHTAVVLAFLAAFLNFTQTYHQTFVARTVAVIGKNSLECYLVSCLSVYFFSAIAAAIGLTPAEIIVFSLTCAAFVGLTGILLERYKQSHSVAALPS